MTASMSDAFSATEACAETNNACDQSIPNMLLFTRMASIIQQQMTNGRDTLSRCCLCVCFFRPFMIIVAHSWCKILPALTILERHLLRTEAISESRSSFVKQAGRMVFNLKDNFILGACSLVWPNVSSGRDILPFLRSGQDCTRATDNSWQHIVP